MYGGHLPVYICIGGIFRKTTVVVLRAQTQNADLVQIDSACRTDLVAVRYSAISSGLVFFSDASEVEHGSVGDVIGSA
jgi:hypothetical protein